MTASAASSGFGQPSTPGGPDLEHVQDQVDLKQVFVPSGRIVPFKDNHISPCRPRPDRVQDGIGRQDVRLIEELPQFGHDVDGSVAINVRIRWP